MKMQSTIGYEMCNQWCFGVCQLNCVTLDCQELLGDNSERLFLGKLGQGSMPCLSFSTLVA